MNTRKIIKYWLLCAALGASLSGHAQQADSIGSAPLPDRYGQMRVSASVDTALMTVGDRHTLHLIVDQPGNAKVAFPPLEALTTGAVEALDMHIDTSRDASGAVSRLEQVVTLTSFDEGTHPITGMTVMVQTAQGAVMLAPADSLFLRVAFVAEADTTKCNMQADATYYEEPPTFWEVARWPLLGLLIAAVIAAVVWIIVRRRSHKPVFVLPKMKPVPADKRALSELETLRRKELWQKGLIKRYYTDMTDIVRRYLRNMYGIKAGEMTSRQTLRAFHGIADWSEESEQMLRQLFQKADMVKFAKSTPESYEHDQAMQFAVDFVRTVAETHRQNNPEEGGTK